MYARWGTPHNNSSINFYVRLCGHFLAKSVLAESTAVWVTAMTDVESEKWQGWLLVQPCTYCPPDRAKQLPMCLYCNEKWWAKAQCWWYKRPHDKMARAACPECALKNWQYVQPPLDNFDDWSHLCTTHSLVAMEGCPLVVDGDGKPVDTRITNLRTPLPPCPPPHGSVGRHDQLLPPGPPPHGFVGAYSPPDPVPPLALPDLPRDPPAPALEVRTVESRIAALESVLMPTGVRASVPGQGSVIDRLAALENAMTACHAAVTTTLSPAISNLERQVRDLQRGTRENRWQTRAFAMWLMRHRASDAWYYYDDVDALLGLMWDENDNWDWD